jgi:hypothetical protein
MLLARHQIAGQNRDIGIADRPFENVSQLKYLGTITVYMFGNNSNRWKFDSGGN